MMEIYSMKKRFIYEFDGKIWVDAKNQEEAEKLFSGKELNYYILNENIYEVDQFYVSDNLNKREQDWGSFYHPVLECDEYSEYKKRYYRYNDIFKDFLHGKINKKDLIERMDKADKENLKDCDPIVELQAYDLEGELKTVRHYYVGEKIDRVLTDIFGKN